MTAPNITTIDASTTVTTTVVVPPSQEPSKTETPEEKQQRILTHKLLARQLEYYFSTANLSKDTYLSTLRDLNDSYVPVSIISNFSKVQALAPFESALEAVVVAATDYSDLLEIVKLEDGKRVNTEQEEKKEDSQKTSATIMAIGSVSREPIPMSQIPKTEKPKRAMSDSSTSKAPASNTDRRSSTGSVPASSNVQNTIILREVAEDVNEETLKSLFGFDGCPSIESIRKDLHNCWFITLNTSSKDDMFNVMMKLRTTKFPSGDPVKARLKSSASASPSPISPTAVVYNPELYTMYAPQFLTSGQSGGSTTRKKRSSNKGKNNNNGGSNNNNKSKNNQNNGNNNARRRNNSKDLSSSSNKPSTPNDGTKTRTKKVTMKPPSMGENNFPSLPLTSDGNSKPFQVEKVPTDDELLRSCGKKHSASAFSDSSSTATTSTASTPTEAPPSGAVAGGYAAALLRPAAPKKAVAEKPNQHESQQQPPSSQNGMKVKDNNIPKKAAQKSKDGKNENKKPTESSPTSNDQPPVSVQPPSWGQGRSFADIVSA